MQNIQKVISELSGLQNLRFLIETYEIIAATLIRQIRHSVLQNREFHEGLTGIFLEVKQAYLRELERAGRRPMPLPLFAQKNGKAAYMMLSVNSGLYGDITGKVFRDFMQEFHPVAMEAVIVGKVGASLFEDTLPGVPYTYFDFPDTKFDPEGLRSITKYLNEFEEVVVFHGEFKTLFLQRPARSHVTGDLALMTGISQEVRYLFEPKLETIVAFFETEIFASLLEQVFHESRLSKVASRMMLLDGATSNIGFAESALLRHKQKLQHMLFNRKQLDAISGASLWSNE